MKRPELLDVIIRQNIEIEFLKKKEEELLKLLSSLYDINLERNNTIAILERKLNSKDQNDRLQQQGICNKDGSGN